MAQLYDCIIIGGGPGGLVAAIYLQRLRRRVLLIDGGEPRAARIPKIRNLIGYEEGISGKELLRRLHRQYAKCGGRLRKGRASVRRRKGLFAVTVNQSELHARKVILATGMRDIEPAFGNLRELTQSGLLGYCPVCDAFDHRDQRIALIVRDLQGVKKVGFMRGFSRSLMVITMAAVKIPEKMRENLRRQKVALHQGPALRMEKNSKGAGVIFYFEDKNPVCADAAYVMMGVQVPGDAVTQLRGLKKDDEGFLQVNSHQETTVPGLFAVGDCVHALSQVSVAVGHAAIAATHVHNCLRD